MRTFHEVLESEYQLEEVDDGKEEVLAYRAFLFGKDDRYELAIEPLLGGQWMVALYDRFFSDEPFGGPALLLDKLPVRPGGIPE